MGVLRTGFSCWLINDGKPLETQRVRHVESFLKSDDIMTEYPLSLRGISFKLAQPANI
jgi:hypothetical protein